MPSFIKVTHRRVGRDPMEYMISLIDTVHGPIQAELTKAGEVSAETMREIIRSSGYKLDKLASAIDSVSKITSTEITVNIGEIQKFPKDEKGRDYWNAFNDGWLPPKDYGHWDGDTWHHAGTENPSYWMTPSKPIKPLKFAETGRETLVAHILSEIDRILRSTK